MNNNLNKTVVIVGPFSFPNGGAAARRILGVAKSLQASGYEVKIACGQMGQISSFFENIEVISLNERTAEHLPRFLKHLAYFKMGQKTVTWLRSLKTTPHAVIIYSGYSPYLLRLLPWAKSQRVQLVFDAVEWYDPPSRLGWISPYQLNIEFAMRFLLPRTNGVISISDYLHNYYIARGCKSVLVPPTLDVPAIPLPNLGRDVDGVLKLVYAGSPGRKDLLDSIVEAVLRMRADGQRIHLTVAGLTAEDARCYPAVRSRPVDIVAAGINFLGIVSHQASLDLVRQADFSVLLRNDARYSRAGFPTKFVESLSVGTPVIANLTSDLHRYLKDGLTGFVCSGSEPAHLVLTLTRAITLTSEQHSLMRLQSRELALQSFDYRAFVTSLAQFFKSEKD